MRGTVGQKLRDLRRHVHRGQRMFPAELRRFSTEEMLMVVRRRRHAARRRGPGGCAGDGKEKECKNSERAIHARMVRQASYSMASPDLLRASRRRTLRLI